jgi:succinoglycan biosynthesis transport protein ExoP
MNTVHSESGDFRSTAASNSHPGSMAAPTLLGSLNWSFVQYAIGRWWRIATPVGILTAAGLSAYVYFAVGPTYQAEAWVKIEESKPMLAFQNADSPRFINTQIELIRSPMVLDPVISQPEIAKLPELNDQISPVKWLSERISVRSIGGSELYKIVYESPNVSNSAAICNAILDSYLKVQADFSDTQSQRTVELLDQELQRRSAELERMQLSLKELTRRVTGKDPGLAASAKDKVHLLKMDNPFNLLNDRLATTEVERQVMEAEQKAIKEHLEQQLVPITPAMISEAVENAPEVVQLKAEVAAFKERTLDAKTVSGLGDNHPTVKQYKTLLERTEKRLAEAREKLVGIVGEQIKANSRIEQQASVVRLQGQVSTQKALEDLLREKLKKQKEEMEVLGDHSLELEFARAELMREEVIYERIAERTAALRTEMRAPGRVMPLKRAVSGEVRLSKDPMTRILLVSIVGLLVPFALAVIWERRVRRVASSEQVMRDTNVQVIAEICDLPVLQRGSHKRSLRYDRLRAMYEESIDLLRNSLTLPEKNKDVQVICVCSSVSGEGKTSLACQLAVSLARSVQRPVLLIDSDMRAPDVHRKFDIENNRGLAEILQEHLDMNDAIVPWTDNIHIITAGKLTKSPHSIVNSGVIADLIAKAKSRYEYVVIDCPPLMAASESFVFAKESDGALLCVMRDVSRAPQVQFAAHRLSEAGIRPLGLVLNGVKSEDYGYRYGGYSYHSTHHGKAIESSVAT